VTERRVFTVDEANRTLPYVSRVVADIVRDYRLWQETVSMYDAAVLRVHAGEQAGRPQDGEAARLEMRVAEVAAGIESYINEVTAIGCEVKGLEDGLVDFPGEIRGRPILLCWKLGEVAVEYWHDLEGGFAARKPISDLATAGTI